MYRVYGISVYSQSQLIWLAKLCSPEFKYYPLQFVEILSSDIYNCSPEEMAVIGMKKFLRLLEEKLQPSDVKNLKYILAESFTGQFHESPDFTAYRLYRGKRWEEGVALLKHGELSFFCFELLFNFLPPRILSVYTQEKQKNFPNANSAFLSKLQNSCFSWKWPFLQQNKQVSITEDYCYVIRVLNILYLFFS